MRASSTLERDHREAADVVLSFEEATELPRNHFS